MFVSLILSLFVNAESCEQWFVRNKLDEEKSCPTACFAKKTDLSTMRCRDQCEVLCANNQSQTPPELTLLDLYPGLSPEEKKLCDQENVKCLRAYILSWDSDRLCLNLFYKSWTNDASDACRHYVWARKLALEMESDFAEKVVTAHESDPKQPPREKAKDVANNRLALSKSAKDRANKIQRTDEEILEEFRKSWKSGDLTIIKEKPDNIRRKK